MGFHADLTLADIHAIARWLHADAAARAAEVVEAKDIGKVSWQLSDDTFWALKTVSPATWVSIGALGGGPFSPAITGEPNGFISQPTVDLALDESTRVLTISGSHDIYTNGIFISKQDPENLTLPDVEGSHFIFYDVAGDLQETPTFDIDIIFNNCFVAQVYWDAVNKRAIPWVINELHGASMSPATHSYLHNVVKAAWVSGIQITLDASGNGDADSHAQFSATAGNFRDEDISHTCRSRTLLDNIPKLFLQGAAPVWRMDNSTPFAFLKGAQRATFNEFTGGQWQQTEIGSNGNCVLGHVYAAPGPTLATGGLFIIQGQAQYANASQARSNAEAEANAIETIGLPINEFVRIATLIGQTSIGYTNQVATRFVNAADGDFIDWRSSAGGTPASPGQTLGLPLNNYVATAAPTVNDDASAGYSAGSEWVDTVGEQAYRCISSAVGSALWKQTTT